VVTTPESDSLTTLSASLLALLLQSGSLPESVVAVTTDAASSPPPRTLDARRRSTSSDVSDELDGLTAAAAELVPGWTRASAQPRHSECQQPGSWTGRTYRCRHAGHLSSSSIRDQHSISSG